MDKIKLYFFATPNFKVYRGYDLDGDGINLLKDGASVSVSPKKAEILLADYPLNFSESKQRPDPDAKLEEREPPGNPGKDEDQGVDDAKKDDESSSESPPGEE